MRREISEETGYRLRDLKRIAQSYLSPGGSEQLFYYAEIDPEHPRGTGDDSQRNRKILNWSSSLYQKRGACSMRRIR